MKNLSDAIVDKLLKCLNDKNMTQYKLAEISGVPFPTIKSIIQRRTKTINLKTLIMLSSGLELTVSEFLDDECFKIENLNLE